MTPTCLRSEETAQRVEGTTSRPTLRPRGRFTSCRRRSGLLPAGTFCAAGCVSFRTGAFDAVGDGGVWWWMHRSWEGCFVSGSGVGQDVRRDAVARVVAGESASAVGRVLGYRRGTVSRWCQAAVVVCVKFIIKKIFKMHMIVLNLKRKLRLAMMMYM